MSWLSRALTLPKAQRDKIQKAFAEASKSRLAASVAKAALGGVIASALSGQTAPKSLGVGAITGAGAAFLNFLKQPQDAPATETETP